MNTTENNKLIAEFRGGKYVDECLMEFEDFYAVKEIVEGDFIYTNCFDSDNELQFHSSWDWLMPVVEKIESLEGLDVLGFCSFAKEPYSVDIKAFSTCINVYGTASHKPSISFKRVGTKLENTYLAVVEFIKWYNENK